MRPPINGGKSSRQAEMSECFQELVGKVLEGKVGFLSGGLHQ
jgi:hypothetical protein